MTTCNRKKRVENGLWFGVPSFLYGFACLIDSLFTLLGFVNQCTGRMTGVQCPTGAVKVKVKIKVKLSLCLTKHRTMKAYWGWRYSSPHSLTSALDGGEWSASRPGRFTPRERAP
jgi:hypothetical protein